MSAPARHLEALRVIVIAEPLGFGKESYDVDVTAHPKVNDEWVVGMLRQIADGIERDHESTSSGSTPKGGNTSD